MVNLWKRQKSLRGGSILSFLGVRVIFHVAAFSVIKSAHSISRLKIGHLLKSSRFFISKLKPCGS